MECSLQSLQRQQVFLRRSCSSKRRSRARRRARGEGDASPVALCATSPANATVDDVELYVRTADSETPWSASRVTAGQDAGQARFADKPVEVADSATAKQVCESFVQWSSEHGRVARVVVRYTL